MSVDILLVEDNLADAELAIHTLVVNEPPPPAAFGPSTGLGIVHG